LRPQDFARHDVLDLQWVLRFAGIAAFALFSGVVRAQVAGSVVVESDYRFRGVSLSGGDPTAHLNLSYDHPTGWYAGAGLASVEVEPGPRRAALSGYAGYVRRIGAPGAWEVGAILNRFAGASNYDYDEVFAGFTAERWTARVYLSPDYFGRGVRTMYAELNGAIPLTTALRGFAHVGALARLSGDTAAGIGPARYDARVGVALRVADVDVRLAWVDTSEGVPYVGAYAQRRSTIVLSAAYEF
jgi:uncharacterized protein (TIGR02001 family)